MEEKPEADEGYVTLVNAEIAPDGTVTECAERTGHWAWKHPHHDGTLTYTELTGAITMEDVDFGYVPEKTVLHDITLYANPGQKIAFVGATDDDCIAAARRANADGFIRMLPEGSRPCSGGTAAAFPRASGS